MSKFEQVLAASLRNPGYDYEGDFEHENGQYMHFCINQECKAQFTGGKYRFLCFSCNNKRVGQDSADRFASKKIPE